MRAVPRAKPRIGPAYAAGQGAAGPAGYGGAVPVGAGRASSIRAAAMAGLVPAALRKIGPKSPPFSAIPHAGGKRVTVAQPSGALGAPDAAVRVALGAGPQLLARSRSTVAGTGPADRPLGCAELAAALGPPVSGSAGGAACLVAYLEAAAQEAADGVRLAEGTGWAATLLA